MERESRSENLSNLSLCRWSSRYKAKRKCLLACLYAIFNREYLRVFCHGIVWTCIVVDEHAAAIPASLRRSGGSSLFLHVSQSVSQSYPPSRQQLYIFIERNSAWDRLTTKTIGKKAVRASISVNMGKRFPVNSRYCIYYKLHKNMLTGRLSPN